MRHSGHNASCVSMSQRIYHEGVMTANPKLGWWCMMCALWTWPPVAMRRPRSALITQACANHGAGHQGHHSNLSGQRWSSLRGYQRAPKLELNAPGLYSYEG